MKLFKKIMAIVAASALISSLSIFNIAHANEWAYSLALTDAAGEAITEIKAGDDFYIDLRINTDEDLRGYKYDINVGDLIVDNSLVTKKIGRVTYEFEAHVDPDWYLNENLNTMYFSIIKVNYVKSTKKISGVFAGDAIGADLAVENALVGRFKVKADKDYTADSPLVLTMEGCGCTDKDMNDLDVTPSSLTFPEASDEPVGPTVVDGSVGDTIVKTSTIPGKGQYAGVTATFDAGTYSAITFNFDNGLTTAPYVWDLTGANIAPIEGAGMVFGLNIQNIPAEIKTFKCTGVTATVAE